MVNQQLFDIAASLSDKEEYCGRCGRNVVLLDKVKGEWISSCRNKYCARFCHCQDILTQNKLGKELTEKGDTECLIHWKCQCEKGVLCDYHRRKPELVTIRYGNRDKGWAYATGFDVLNEQAKQWIALYKIQREKALSRCGSCRAWLKTSVDKQGKKTTYCPKGCVCHCADNKDCVVHFNCGCLSSWICQFHETKRPDVAVALYNALPPNDRARKILETGFDKAGIEYWKYKQKGRKPKELKILPVATVAVKEPLDVRLSEAELIQKMAELDKPFKLSSPPETLLSKASTLEVNVKAETKAKSKDKLESKAKSPSESESTFATGSKPKIKPVEQIAAAKFDLASELDSQLPSYKKWLSKQLLSANSCRNYVSRIVAFIEFLKESKEDYPPLSAATKDLPVRDLRLHLKKTAKLKPATLNSYLSAIDNFYGFLEIGTSKVKRDEMPQEAPQALSARDQKKFLRAVELTKRVKDRAIATLLFYTGMRLSECTDLELGDVFIIGRKTRAVIRSGKGGKYREVPLNSIVCSRLEEWLQERKKKYAGRSVATALFLNPQGNAMLPNSVYEIIRKIGRECALELSPHTLRHTLLTNLIRKQNDVVLVADIAGHRSLNTTRRYTLPSAADKAKALEALLDK
ncbi:MAG: tyrosine-type recombinase/integrase [Candidatus Obscuribacterales bacterium]